MKKKFNSFIDYPYQKKRKERKKDTHTFIRNVYFLSFSLLYRPLSLSLLCL